MSLRFVALVSSALLVSSCTRLDIVHELEEREANEILVALDEAKPSPISAQKVPDGEGGGGNKGPRFKITVAAGDATRAFKLLSDNSLPRKKDSGLSDVFSGGGLVPTAGEEKAKMIVGVQGELARTLKSIDGILDARVHVVMPEDSVLRAKEEDKAVASASVWYKYVPRDKAAVRPLSDEEVKQLVANSVERLKAENVKVIATPGLAMMNAVNSGDPDAAAAGGLQSIVGITVARSDVNKLRGMIAGAIALIVLLTSIFLVALLKKSAPPKRGALSRPDSQ
jgi:type III secretion protein J